MKHLIYCLFLLTGTVTTHAQLFQSNISNGASLVKSDEKSELIVLKGAIEAQTYYPEDHQGKMNEFISKLNDSNKEFVLINPAIVANIEDKQFDLNLGFQKKIGTQLNSKENLVTMSGIGNFRIGGQLDGTYSEIIRDQNFAGGVKLLGAIGLNFKEFRPGRKSILSTQYYLHCAFKERKFKHISDFNDLEFESKASAIYRLGLGISHDNSNWYDAYTLFDASYSLIIQDNFDALAEYKLIERSNSGETLNQKETSVYSGAYDNDINIHAFDVNWFFSNCKNSSGAKFGLLINPEFRYSVNTKKAWSNLKLTVFLYNKRTDEDEANSSFPYKPDIGITFKLNDLTRASSDMIINDAKWEIGATKAFYFKSN